MKMNKIRVTKYKLIDTDISEDIAKKIVGKQFTVEKVKAKGGPATKPRAKAPTWFVEFEKRNNHRLDKIENNISNLNNRMDRIENRMDKQDTRLIKIENRLDTIDNRLDKNDKRFENIEHELSI